MGSDEIDESLMRHQEIAKSLEDMKGERIGATVGCSDPGDDMVLDLIAELGLDAHPEYDTDQDCQHCSSDKCKTADGRGNSERRSAGSLAGTRGGRKISSPA